MIADSRSSLLHRYLDPASSLGEVLFGLIMTLTFTLGAGIIIEDQGREGARELLIAVIGCNIAWGIIDGALYLAGQLFDRGRLRRLAQAVRDAADQRLAVTLIAGELDALLENVTNVPERDALYARIATNLRSGPLRANTIRKADLLGAVTSFWLVVLSSIPAAIPFLFIDDARFALRVSNAILLVALFITGYSWARHTLGKPWLVGLSFLIGGVALVAVSIALGG
jgi:VIT family